MTDKDVSKESSVETSVADRAPAEQLILNVLRAQMPNLQTQAQFDLFMACFDALRIALNAYFGRDQQSAEIARGALNAAIDLAASVTDAKERLAEIPPEERSRTASEFLNAPREFCERDEQKQLVREVAGILSFGELQEWYARTAERRNRIADQTLRNEMFDAIRSVKSRLLEMQK